MRINIPVVPSPPVCVIGQDFCWVSGFDAESTILPGAARAVTEQKSGRPVGELEYRSPGHYRLNAAGVQMDIAVRGEEFLVTAGGRPVARSRRAGPDDRDILLADGMETEKRFSVELEGSLPTRCKALILAFPALRFF